MIQLKKNSAKFEEEEHWRPLLNAVYFIDLWWSLSFWQKLQLHTGDVIYLTSLEVY